MFCLRSWLPLLFIPTNASPLFIFLFFVCTYFLNRPCVYCSFLLLVLFASSCNWADHCFFDFSSNWFEARPLPVNETIAWGTEMMMATETSKTLGTVALDQIRKRVVDNRMEWTGLGVGWLRSLLGRREWIIPCVELKVRL